MQTNIIIYTKPGCPYCERSKDVLNQLGLPFEDRNIESDSRTADESIYLSGVATVPQIFIGDRHVNGSEDLIALADSGRLVDLVEEADGQIHVDDVDDESVSDGARDLPLREAIPEIDPIETDDPEQWGIMHHFKQTFGFLPNSAYYQAHWPEAYKLYSYTQYFDTETECAEVLGKPLMLAISWATSNAHGCNYCRVHTTSMGDSLGGMESGGVQEMIERARNGDGPPDSPIGPFELSLVDVAASSSKNNVAADEIQRVYDLADQARKPNTCAEQAIEATAMICAAFGFLNIFNDIVNVRVENEWAQKASTESGIETGRHGRSEDRESNNLDYRLPSGGPTTTEMQAKLNRLVDWKGGVESYCEQELGLTPNWIRAYPESYRRRHAVFYAEVMQPRLHCSISSELRHLIARVSAIVKGHDYLASAEGYLAWQQSNLDSAAIERVRCCFDAAVGRPVGDEVFNDRERAALTFAWLSAQTPLTTPARFLQPAIDHFTPRELIQLSFVVSIASMVQRFVAIQQHVGKGLETEEAVLEWHHERSIAQDSLAIRYPSAFQPSSQYELTGAQSS